MTFDKEKYRQYKNRNRGRRHLRSDRILAFDGEGITDKDGIHHYFFLASSDGENKNSIFSTDLSTRRCFDFILNHPKNAVFVGFSFNYDINMMLRDIDHKNLVRLWETGKTRWFEYKISWIPSKKFTITKGNETRTIWDVFGFFQCSFIKALKEWEIGSAEEVATISQMKDVRGKFDEVDIEKIKSYCFDECRLLVTLVTKLIMQTRAVEIMLTSYHGAGSIAAAILRKYDVDKFLTPPPEEVFNVSLNAYYGGRFEISRVGITRAKIYGYDIRSAYPDQIRFLPCLSCGFWRHERGDFREGGRKNYRCLVAKVRWSIPLGSQWGPFPFRLKDGTIFYPIDGEGWYWHDEILAATELYPDAIQVDEFWYYNSECEHQPFNFVENLYNFRNQLKQNGNFGQIILKLGLNSLYGKTAQSIGHGNRKPPFQSFIWAGIITSGTRAKILRAIASNPGAVISIATDGIVSLDPLPLGVGTNLGEWEFSKPADSIFIAQAGVYRYTVETVSYCKTRGFSIRELSFDALESEFISNGLHGRVQFNCTRFIGLGASLFRRPPLTDWRRWIVRSKEISFNIMPRRIPRSLTSQISESTDYVDTISPILLTEQTVSAPYKLKGKWNDMYVEDEDFVENMDQPMFID